MDLDKALVASVSYGGKAALLAVLEKGITHESLIGEGRELFEYIQEHVSQFGEVPSPDVLSGKLGVYLDPLPPGSNAAFFAQEVQNRNLHFKLTDGLKDPLDFIDKRKPEEAFAALQDLIFEIQKEQLGNTDTRIQKFFELGDDVWEHYRKIKSGERGVLTPWPTINDSTLGFWPEEVILFVARSGIGKTWAALLMCQSAWAQGKKVLFVTTEMSKLAIALRFYAIQLKLPYGRLRSGMLTMMEEQKFQDAIQDLKIDERFFIVGGNFDFRVESLASAVDEAEPDLVVIDGIYLLKSSGQSRTDRAAEAFNDVKRLATYKKLPVVVTSQFNRDVKVNKANTAKAESVALTDVAVWNAQLIYGLVQTEDNKRERRMIIKRLKDRDGSGEDFELNWDFDLMDFSEVASNDPSGATAGSMADPNDPGDVTNNTGMFAVPDPSIDTLF